jgi:hypothetical protein
MWVVPGVFPVALRLQLNFFSIARCLQLIFFQLYSVSCVELSFCCLALMFFNVTRKSWTSCYIKKNIFSVTASAAI